MRLFAVLLLLLTADVTNASSSHPREEAAARAAAMDSFLHCMETEGPYKIENVIVDDDIATGGPISVATWYKDWATQNQRQHLVTCSGQPPPMPGQWICLNLNCYTEE